MSLHTEDIRLEPDLQAYRVNVTRLLSIWDELGKYSVESAVVSRPALFDFILEHCLYAASIQRYIRENPEQELEEHEEGLGGRIDAINGVQTAQVQEDYCGTAWDTSDNGMPYGTAQLPPAFAGSSSESEHPANVTRMETAGFVYITSTQMPSEMALGIALHPDAQGLGLATQAMNLMLHWAFDELKCHRVQVAIMDSPTRTRALRLFTSVGFRQEGTRRRVVPSVDGAWADVTYMGLLDTEWLVRARDPGPLRSMWDELLERHQREREEVLRAEEHRLRRTASQETVRFVEESDIDPDSAAPTDTEDQRDSSPPSSAISSARASPIPGVPGGSRALSGPPGHTPFTYHDFDAIGMDHFRDDVFDLDIDDDSDFSYVSIPQRSRSQSTTSARSWSSVEVSSVASSTMRSVSDDEDI
ncbi:hypothetical protein OBBRIDRAFT_796425 [Obba rivulosa]|uniref:N-acetyltransferase domain-containing protein n=1 Tax=Obba rivulosa TaxID=1052685 RepID=A0A8E2ART9_9APHY|nr:hypothetical protein OBBRIDRAFT_796425 [Obba rivulosa]